jgi:hypothetical protein
MCLGKKGPFLFLLACHVGAPTEILKKKYAEEHYVKSMKNDSRNTCIEQKQINMAQLLANCNIKAIN